MPFAPRTLADFAAHGFDTVIDARAPSEFAEDRLPGAVNLPVLSDAERARVGTVYVQQSAFRARKIGAALVARNLAGHLEGPLAEMEGGWRPLVYCWRGGQRSGAFAAILGQIGWRVEVLEGGYRRFRRMVKAALYDAPPPCPVVLLDGDTGTGKTALLPRLAARGVQVLDLEGLAAHRGSVLGPVDRPQPSQKGFESALAMALAGLDPARPVVVEAESSRIGERMIPPGLWSAMRGAPRMEIAAPPAARAAFLARAYADMTAEPERLLARLEQLVPFHGRAAVEAWAALVHEREWERLAAELMERHYDPRYAKSRARRGGGGPDRGAGADGPARGAQTGTVLARFEAEGLDDAGLDALADALAAELARRASAG